MKQAAIRHSKGEESEVRRTTLPPDILQAASRRVGWAALILAGLWVIATLAGKLSKALGGTEAIPREFRFTLLGIILVLSIVVFLLSRRRDISPVRLFDIGLIYGVVGSFIISLVELWHGLHGEAFEIGRGISWVCVWMLTFPLLMPASPRKVFFALTASALTAQAVMALAVLDGAPLPHLSVRIWLFLPNLLCIGVGLVVSRLIYKLGAEISTAREMGSYRLEGKLGEGGMGEVWKARHRMLARPAAIKLIRPEAMGATGPHGVQTLTARFEREAQATASLKSPHTIQLFDFGVTEEGVFYYVMELLDGMDLSSMVKRFGQVSPERTVHFLKRASRSLAEAHRAGLIHRDIKPANLYACRLGLEYDFVKVLDFGLVKSREGAIYEGDSELTQAKTASGTPAFMPPEIATGEQNVDGRADLYALGCVGYWLLTGHHVFSGSTPMKVVVAHVKEKPVPPSQRTELAVPPDLDRIILSLLEKDPDRRPQDATELLDILRRLEFTQPWTQENARKWWDTNQPGIEHPPAPPKPREPIADTVI